MQIRRVLPPTVFWLGLCELRKQNAYSHSVHRELFTEPRLIPEREFYE